VPEIIKVLAGGDNNPHSKKDAAVRQGELRTTVVPALLKCIAAEAGNVVGVGAATHVVLEAVLAATAETAGLDECAVAIAATATRGSINPGGGAEAGAAAGASAEKPLTPEETSIMANAAGHRLVQKLLGNDSPMADVLASELVGVLEGSIAEWAAINRGSFVLMAIVNGPNAKAKVAVEAEVKPALKTLAKSDAKGTVRLLELLGLVTPSASAGEGAATPGKAKGGKKGAAGKATPAKAKATPAKAKATPGKAGKAKKAM
jgi:hypothetical protein